MFYVLAGCLILAQAHLWVEVYNDVVFVISSFIKRIVHNTVVRVSFAILSYIVLFLLGYFGTYIDSSSPGWLMLFGVVCFILLWVIITPVSVYILYNLYHIKFDNFWYGVVDEYFSLLNGGQYNWFDYGSRYCVFGEGKIARFNAGPKSFSEMKMFEDLIKHRAKFFVGFNSSCKTTKYVWDRSSEVENPLKVYIDISLYKIGYFKRCKIFFIILFSKISILDDSNHMNELMSIYTDLLTEEPWGFDLNKIGFKACGISSRGLYYDDVAYDGYVEEGLKRFIENVLSKKIDECNKKHNKNIRIYCKDENISGWLTNDRRLRCCWKLVFRQKMDEEDVKYVLEFLMKDGFLDYGNCADVDEVYELLFGVYYED